MRFGNVTKCRGGYTVTHLYIYHICIYIYSSICMYIIYTYVYIYISVDLSIYLSIQASRRAVNCVMFFFLFFHFWLAGEQRLKSRSGKPQSSVQFLFFTAALNVEFSGFLRGYTAMIEHGTRGSSFPGSRQLCVSVGAAAGLLKGT